MANRNTSMIESLEGRRLLAATAVASINFAPLSAHRAPGLLTDYGAVYGVRRGGLSYGWSQDLTANGVERNLTKVQKNDTFIAVPQGAKWEIAVPDGEYQVYLVAGDIGAKNERVAVNIEGAVALSGVTKAKRPFVEGLVDVAVTDGKITIEDAPWVSSNKFAYLAVQSLNSDTPTTTGTLSVTATTPSASENGPTSGVFKVTRTGSTTGAATVPLTFGGTATNGTDYTKIGTSLTFAAGVSSLNIPVNVLTDTATEGAETVTLTLGATTGYTFGTKSATVTIADHTATTTASWSKGPNAPDNIGEVAGGIVNGKMYMIGGANRKTYVYNIAAGTWASNLATRPLSGDHYGAEVINGKIYIFGGLGASAGQLQIYNPATNSWSRGAAMPYSGGSVNTSLIGGKVYVAGGIVGTSSSNYTGTGTTNKAAVYNPATNTWSTIASMPVGRNHAAGGTDGSKFYIFGGRDGANKTTNGFNDVQIYNPATNTWVWSNTAGSGIPNLPQARGGMGKAVFANGEFYVMGGETHSGAGATSKHVYTRVDIYNPVTKTWRLGPNMITGRHGIFPMLSGNKIYVAMGGAQAEGGDTNVFEILNLG